MHWHFGAKTIKNTNKTNSWNTLMMKKKLLMVLLGVGIGMGSVSTVSAAAGNNCQKELGDCFYDQMYSKGQCYSMFRACLNS
ncbi:MAG: hypothetical protein HRT35_18880 [Algicola sp.]|nr:hypothetical protein [Algicola sp.]